MPPGLRGELGDTCRGKASEQVLDAHDGCGVAACLVTQGCDRVARVEVELVEQEAVRVDDGDVICRCRCVREVADVEGDEDRGIAADGRISAK